ncbi:hypothetical protein [[Mycoplasma] collis]|uniref:hypothetical protein n=1 Tax=[Mycoplasma] collis TaxID=2127 RepID=UPI00051B24BD|nr:hypothetical protein [[Mycoplasma] collis]
MNKKLFKFLFSFLPLVFSPFLISSSYNNIPYNSNSTSETMKEEEIINLEKLKSNINYVDIKSNNYNAENAKLTILYNENEYQSSNKNILNYKLEFLKKIFNILNNKIQITFLPFNNQFEYDEQIKTIEKNKTKYILHLYKNIDANQSSDNESISLSYLNKLTVENRIINFSPWTNEENIFDHFLNFFSISALNTTKTTENLNKITVHEFKTPIETKYNNFYRKQNSDISVNIDGVINNKVNHSANASFYASAIFISSFFDFLIYSKSSNINSDIKIINSFLLSAKKYDFFTEKYFNNQYIGIGSGFIDYENAWNTYNDLNSFSIKKTREFLENEVILEKDFSLKKDEIIAINTNWFLNLVNFNFRTVHFGEIFLDSLNILTTIDILKNRENSEFIKKHLKSNEHTFFIENKFNNNLDLVLEFFDNDWKVVAISEATIKNYEEIKYKVKYDGRYKIKLIAKTDLPSINEIHLNFVQKKSDS